MAEHGYARSTMPQYCIHGPVSSCNDSRCATLAAGRQTRDAMTFRFPGRARFQSDGLAFQRALLFRLRAANLVCRLMPPLTLSTARVQVYRWAGFPIASQVAFQGSMSVIGSGAAVYGRLHIGEGTTVGVGLTVNLDDEIHIGSNVALGPGVTIFTSGHLLGPGSRRMNPTVVTRPVRIEDGVWVGAGVMILSGVTIGRGAVIAAGSVVAESVGENVLARGNPAKAVDSLPFGDR